VFSLFGTVSKNDNLNKFEFIQRWPALSEQEKLSKVSTARCTT